MTQLGCYTGTETNALDCAVQGLFSATLGQGVFALIVAAILVISMYVATNGGIAVPATLLTLMGSFLLVAIPPQYQTTAQVLIFVGMAAGVLALANKYVMQP